VAVRAVVVVKRFADSHRTGVDGRRSGLGGFGGGAAHALVIVTRAEIEAGVGTAGEEEREAADEVKPDGEGFARGRDDVHLRLLDEVGSVGAQGEVGREEFRGTLFRGSEVAHGTFSAFGISTGPGRSSGRS
jgi:hypothetical protein